MEHKHQYDAEGKQLCCTQVDKIYREAGASELLYATKAGKHEHAAHEGHDHSHDHSHDHDHGVEGKSTLSLFAPALISLGLLLTAIVLDNWIAPSWFQGVIRICWYIAAYVPVGIPVLKEAVESMQKGELFSEFLLMGIATLGAFAIREYPEAVAVMLFYAVGENFQSLAVSRAKSNIQALLDQRPDEVSVLEGTSGVKVVVRKAADVPVGAIMQLKPGEKVALDGELISVSASFNTAALTGESKPDTKYAQDTVLAGMINLNGTAQVRVTAGYNDSKLSKILELVQNASKSKAPTELFIRKFARIYTPIVVALAVLITLVPMVFVDDYVFRDWLYRALVFLVISCPCALVISIPLGYFGGIGDASKRGILVKGSNYLDLLAGIQHVVMDKTGTMTEGVFEVKDVVIEPGMDKDLILDLVNSLESNSSHPVASAIHRYAGAINPAYRLEDVQEIAGHGLRAISGGKEILAGNFKLMDKYGIAYGLDPKSIVETLIAFAYDGRFAGYITISDRIKDDAGSTIRQLHDLGIQVTMLSGDKGTVVDSVARTLGIDHAFGDLLPEDKVKYVRDLKARGEQVAFVGDGLNDAPVIALSDVGIAMGGLGSDATIATADVVIQDDMPSKIPLGIMIGRHTKRRVWQNITLAFVVKALVLILGAGGLATMWEAVFADVGVALLAILNARRGYRGA